ncbi:MAG: hypothetical protein Tsb0021_06070 [Chlamydiales bacterium]
MSHQQLSLDTIRSSLEEQGFECTIQKEEIPYLLLYVEPDEKGRDYIFTITLKEQYLSSQPGPDLKEEGHILHFALDYNVLLPINPKDVALPETARYLCFINRNSQFPGFELDEIESKIYFRVVQFFHSDRWEKEYIHATVGLVLLNLHLFHRDIERVALGKTTMIEILEEALEKVHVSE